MTRHRSFAPSTGTFVVVPEENKKSEPFSNRKQVRIFLVWWARVDSNHRSWKQQIYSLSPLATREHAHIHFLCPSPDDLFILSCRKAFVNCFFTFFFKCVFRAEKRQSKGGKSPAAMQARQSRRKKASRKKLIGKLQEKLGTICEKCKTFCLCIEKRSKAWYIKNATKCNKMDGAFVTLWQIRRDK